MLLIPASGSDAVTIKDDSDRWTELPCRNMASSPMASPILQHVSAGPGFDDDMNHRPAKSFNSATMKRVRRILIAGAGTTVLVLGIALLVLPGPAFLVIPAGLGILAIEFAWARRWLRTARGWVQGNAGVNGACSETRNPPSASGKLWHGLKAIINIGIFATALVLLLVTGAALMAMFAVWCCLLKASRQARCKLRNAMDLLRQGHSLPQVHERG